MGQYNKEQECFFPNDVLLVSKTDTRGIITYANETFIAIVGYSEEELIGQPHNLVRHPDMPRAIFKILWSYLKAGSEINAYVKNRTKSGGYYWVFANVTPSRDVSGETIGFHSARRTPSKAALEVIKPLYAQLLEAERSGGLAQSEALLERILQDKGVSYEEFILSI